ncbi:hypothetical protein EAE96_004525 [Botrytis aclada]|nr:hypothetical protein EAE96_004525 [Botrytis aclada]
MPRKNRAAKPKSENQSNAPIEPEPEAQLRESQISTQSQSDSLKEDMGPETQLRESQTSTQSFSGTDAVGPEPRMGSPTASVEEFQDSLQNQEDTLPNYVASQGLGSPMEDDGLQAGWESAPPWTGTLSDEDRQTHGQRQEERLATEIQTSRSGSQMELDVEDDPLHMSSNKVSPDLSHDSSQHPSRTRSVRGEESDSNASLDLKKGGKLPRLSREQKLQFLRGESFYNVADPGINPLAQSDDEPALQKHHSNTGERPESTEPASSSSVPQYQKVQTTEVVRSETTRIIRSFHQEKIRIEKELKEDFSLQNLRQREKRLEVHETALSNLIDELMVDLKKTRGQLKKISRRYREPLAMEMSWNMAPDAEEKID